MFCCREQGNKEGEGGTQKVKTGGAGGKEGGGAQKTTRRYEVPPAGASSIPR